ncbi:hypothetical protein ACRN98_22265 [Shewanella oncorhynchi]|uniref:hypothetical protein n=1 Tax=Shewanella TaxID=22 RepID=UPI0021DA05E5|nr:hypothetical protein [Shewanella sp. SM69]MCU8036990.1 hypothetical protein [Shewanella sp. SM69]
MDILKSLIKIIFFFALFIGLAVLLAKCEHNSSPIVNGKHVGARYECHDGVLYVISGSGIGRSIAPSFNADTGKIVKCSDGRTYQAAKGGE